MFRPRGTRSRSPFFVLPLLKSRGVTGHGVSKT
jgi:hypothetical protein